MDGNIGVADILITPELSRRPARAVDSAAQAQAFHAVALTLDGDASVCFAALAEAARGLCLADSAGVCVLDETGVAAARVRWVARADERAHDGPGDLGREMRATASLCGYCLEQGGPQLFAWPERFFAGMSESEPRVAEALTVPFRAGALRGAIWVSCRDERHRFTAGDAEVLGSLGAVAGAVLAREQAQTEARAMGAGLEQWRLALIANRQFAEHVVESSGDCILELDQEGMALSINSPGLRLMEIDDFAAWRQRAWASWWAEPAATAARAAVAAARAGKAQSFEGPCLTARGRPKWWHVLVTAVAGTHGGPERLLVVCRDATEGREAGEAVQRALATADAANRQKNLFLAALSHELRTPLSPVVLAVAAMQTDARLPEEVRHDLELIRRNVDLEVRLIDDLLDVSRAVSGKLRLTRERAGVHNLLRLALEICASDAHLKKITMRRLWGARVDEINADSARVQQIFWNLLKNSIKFSPEGSVIEVETVNPTPGIIEIRVSDQGQGIEAAMLPRLFEAFEQGSNATTQRFGGLGLGLA
ncbi:MAG TPA: ATP-binding protein, partial [Terriglobales bacterium]